MSLEWKSCKIGDLGKIFSGGTPSTKIKEYWDGDLNWLSSGETRNTYIYITDKFITEEGANNSSTKLANKGDIVIASAGQGFTRGQSSMVMIDTYVNQSVIVISPNDKVNNHYLLYNLKFRYPELRQLSDHASTRGSLTTKIIKGLDINLPDLNTQNKIATIIQYFDKKIETNKRINKNLEEQIETIYNSFFVYYDDFLKEELEECEIGFIPKDWNLMTLGQITTQIKEKVGKNNYKVFSAVNTGNLILSEEYFDKQVFSKSIEKYIVVKQDEFAYNPARINIGSIGRNDFDYEGCVSPVYVAFKVEEGYENFMNMFIKSKRFNQWVITLSSGSVRQTLNYNDFSIIKIAYPPKSLVNKFNVIYESYYEVINYNKSVIYNLEEIRDTLLPKLMSGEIDVSKINCDLELKYNYMKYLFNQIHTPMSKSVV